MPEIPIEFDDYDAEEETEGRSTEGDQSKKRKQGGPLGRFVTLNPPYILKGSKDKKSIQGVCDKEVRDKACGGIAWWMYDGGIPFNAVNYDSLSRDV